jgi:phosphoribosylamine-glycine ligase
MNSRFTPDLEKLNAKFEGYKLNPFNESLNLVRTSLAEVGIQVYDAPNDQHQRLGFRDVQARIRHSHLHNGYPLDHDRGSAFCIDQEFNLHMIVYNKVKNKRTRRDIWL